MCFSKVLDCRRARVQNRCDRIESVANFGDWINIPSSAGGVASRVFGIANRCSAGMLFNNIVELEGEIVVLVEPTIQLQSADFEE